MSDSDGAILPGSPDGPLWDPRAVPAATVVVLRDGPDGLETLMLRRDKDLSFAGGMWVFPGGRIDAEDRSPDDPSDELDALEASARRAAVREAAEESGLVVDPEGLHRWTHWTPPPLQDKRFSTAFFVAVATDATAEIVIDDGEIRAHRWARPGEAIELRDAGEIALAPPTFVTLIQLRDHADTASVLGAAGRRSIEHFSTRVATCEGGWTAVYHGDVTYEELGTAGGMAEVDLEAPGPRHRLSMGDRWSYVREDC